MTSCSRGQDRLLMRCGILYENAMRYVNRDRGVQWTETGIRISPDPRHVKDIIEELGLEGAKPADTPMIVSQSSKKDSDSRATEHAGMPHCTGDSWQS